MLFKLKTKTSETAQHNFGSQTNKNIRHTFSKTHSH